MSATFAFERDPYLRTLEVEVLEVEPGGAGTVVRCSDSVCYPEGGGQPADRGRLAGIPVLGAAQRGDAVWLELAGPVPLGAALLELDWARRYDHMQQHTAQHLLSALAADRWGWRTTSFHLGQEACDIELDVSVLPAARLPELEEAVATEIRRARPVRARRVEEEELRGLVVRSRGLPEGFAGSVRLVEIEGVDSATCGGTHLRSTAEIEALKLLGTEPMRGGTRLYWVAGGRVRRRLADLEGRSAELRRLFGAADGELVAIATKKLAELQAREKSERRLRERLVELEAERAAASPRSLIALEAAELDPPAAARLAQEIVTRRPEAVALVTVPLDEGLAFALARGETSGADLAALGRAVATALGARGGGSGKIFQGRGPAGASHATAAAAVSALWPPRQKEG